MEDGKIHTKQVESHSPTGVQVEIDLSNQVGVGMQKMILLLGLFGLTQELVGIMLLYALVIKFHVAVVITG